MHGLQSSLECCPAYRSDCSYRCCCSMNPRQSNHERSTPASLGLYQMSQASTLSTNKEASFRQRRNKVLLQVPCGERSMVRILNGRVEEEIRSEPVAQTSQSVVPH